MVTVTFWPPSRNVAGSLLTERSRLSLCWRSPGLARDKGGYQGLPPGSWGLPSPEVPAQCTGTRVQAMVLLVSVGGAILSPMSCFDIHKGVSNLGHPRGDG